MDPTTEPFWRQLVTALAQKGLTMAFTALAGYGVLQPDQKSEFIDVGGALALAAASFIWTIVHTHNVNTNAKQAVISAAAGVTAPLGPKP